MRCELAVHDFDDFLDAVLECVLVFKYRSIDFRSGEADADNF